MHKFNVIVIGGGASGIIAAISAKRKCRDVVICEKMPRLAKKLLITGAGRCNLSNENLSELHYNPEARGLVKSVFSRFGKNEISNFFKEIGLRVYSEEGRIFPVTNQAQSVLKILEEELKRLKISIEFSFTAESVIDSGKAFTVKSKDNKSISADSVIIAGGGKTYPSLGSDGSCYSLAADFAHSTVKPVPSAVPLVTKDIFCHLLQGQKISCIAKSIIDGRIKRQIKGEILFTRYGLSGTAILDISEDISIAINRLNKKTAAISLDMVPFMGDSELKKEIETRLVRGFKKEDLMLGILPNKFSLVLKDLLKDADSSKIVSILKDKRFNIIGTRGWNEAEFTAGGVDIKDIKESTLESKLKKGIYFAGEILDVNGERLGYNLAWAWASGYVAGLTE